MDRKMPIGIDDFATAQNYYYVDKTLFIKDLVENHLGKSVLITRPRRFGKSLMLSMLEYFFDLSKNGFPLFEDKKIAAYGEICSQYASSCPVIRLNMKNINGGSAEEIIGKAIDSISELYREYPFLLDDPGLFEIDRKYYLDVVNKRLENVYEYQSSLYKLTLFLKTHYGKKALLLIDEYDTPIESAFENGAYKECIGFFKELFSAALKGNQNVFLSIVTGVLQISKESLFSGLNNLEVLSVIDDPASEYFGFTDSEVSEMMERFGIDKNLDEVREWYGGYRYGGKVMYNPWSIISFMGSGTIRTYWVNTGANLLLQGLLGNGEVFESINGEREVEINTSLSYLDFASDENAIYSYLVQTGYLVAVYVREPNLFRVRIPNREIYETFKNDIIARNQKKEMVDIASSLRNAFIAADVEGIRSILENYIVCSFSYYDLTVEKDYQNVLTTLVAVLFDSYVVKSEVNGKKGRADIMVSPKRKGDLGMVIEVKYNSYPLSRSRLLYQAESAITKQVEAKDYYRELRQRECGKIILFGFAFDSGGNHQIATRVIG